MRRVALYFSVLAVLVATLVRPLEARSRQKKEAERKSAVVQVVERFNGQVIRVSDGDTCDVETPSGRVVRIRIYGIDAPELAQPFGKESRKYLDKKILRQQVIIEKYYDDQYGRCVGRVIMNGKDLALELLEEGIVWHYVQYCNDPAYAKAEQQARQEQKGLWKSSDGGEPTPPWEYRKAHPRRKQ